MSDNIGSGLLGLGRYWLPVIDAELTAAVQRRDWETAWAIYREQAALTEALKRQERLTGGWSGAHFSGGASPGTP